MQANKEANMVIDTEVKRIVVEIEGEEYELAPKTIETSDALVEIEDKLKGKPLYRLWQAELEILLGKEAMGRLFRDGKKENIDRMKAIYLGVANAFNMQSDEMDREYRESKFENINGSIAPLNEFLKLTGNGRK